MPEKFGGNNGPEGDGLTDPLDIELNSVLNGIAEGEPKPDGADKGYKNLITEMAKNLAEARDRQPKVFAGLQLSKWLMEKYPNITGTTTIDELIDFLGKERQRLAKEIDENGGNKT